MFYKGNEKYNKLFYIYILNNLLISLYYHCNMPPLLLQCELIIKERK